MVLSALLSSLSNEVLAQVLFLTTSREVWMALEQMFSSVSRARVIQIRMQLTSLKKNDMSMTNYFHKVKNLADTLSAIGQHLPDEEIVSYMLAGLDSDYDLLVTSITTRADPMTLTDLYPHMLSYKARKEQQNGGLQISNSNANNVRRTGGRGGQFLNRNNQGRGNCGRNNERSNNNSS